MTKVTPESLKAMNSRTRLVHAGRDPFEQHGFINTPIYRGSTVLSPTMEDLYARKAKYIYGTKGTPTTDALETAWSDLAGAAGTVLVPSGLAAISIALLAAVKAGDHVLVADSAYRPARVFCDTVLKRLGVETTYYDPLIGEEIERHFRANTSVVLVEAPGSQSFEVQDIPAISAAARKRGICVVMDNTWATPLFFPPHARGVDMAVEAGTQNLSRPSDLLLGPASAQARRYPPPRGTLRPLAMCAGPEDVFLALRGLRTMELRLREAERQGLEMARWLEARPEVARVLHPAFPSCPGHAFWKRDFLGASGLFSVILKPTSRAAVAAMLDGLQLFGMGYSWGGFESLVIPFDCKTYRTATEWNPGGPALRFSIGLEHADDLKADLAAGFERMKAAG